MSKVLKTKGKTTMKKTIFAISLLAAAVVGAEQVVDISGVGNKKFTVSVNVGNAAFAKCLQKNLEISGLFLPNPNGSIKVTGNVGAITASGSGKALNCTTAFSDDKSARMAARQFANAMCEAWGQQKGFALDKIVFLKHGRQQAVGAAVPGDLCTCYADGYDIRQLTNDGKMSIFPRWKDANTIYFISDRSGATQIWEMNVATERASRKWSFKGTPTGIAVSPDGSRVAAILSFQGNPELYVLQDNSYTRLTTTPYEVEGQPTWSPDGRKIAFVRGDKTQQIWVIDVATRKERRLTSRSRQNIDPDWGKDGRIAYISNGGQIMVMNSADGDSSAQAATTTGGWKHPSWARDGRHVVAGSGKSLFLVDTLKDGDKPRAVFNANGDWISPSWAK